MKKFFAYVLVLAAVMVPAVSLAAEFRAGEQVSINREEKITNDIYMAGSSVNSAGNVTGDLITAGGNIVISGEVGEDLIVGGGNINILSNIGDDVRAGGGTIIIAGKIGGDAILGGGQITLGGSGVEGDAAIGGGDIRIDAPIKGKLSVGGGNVYINAPIGGDVKIEAEKVTLGSGAVISGNLTYKATAELVKETGAVVKGAVNFTPIVKKSVPHVKFAAILSALLVWKFFALLACALVVGLALRRWGKEIIVLATRRPLFEMGKGIIFLIAVPIISVLLFATMVGIPFGILGLLGFVILMIFAWIVTPIIVGSVVYRYFSKKELEISWKTILLGVVLYMLLGLVPFIGCLIQTLLMFMTLGSIVALKMQIIKEWR